jgi:hypothetical protein
MADVVEGKVDIAPEKVDRPITGDTLFSKDAGLEDEEYDDDPGMFSFLAPTASTLPAPRRSLRSDNTRPQTTNSSFISSIRVGLSPAAAYALESSGPPSTGANRRRSHVGSTDESLGYSMHTLNRDGSSRGIESDASEARLNPAGLGRIESGKTDDYDKGTDELGSLDDDAYYFDGFGNEEEDSPYPEVRASVSNMDDPEMRRSYYSHGTRA